MTDANEDGMPMIEEPEGADILPPRARITLRDNVTGQTVTHLEDWTAYGTGNMAPPTLHSIWWQWTAGNYCCDCNRHVEFYRHSDPPSDRGDDEIPCHSEHGGGNRYTMVGFEPA